jgi:hypothetical protein
MTTKEIYINHISVPEFVSLDNSIPTNSFLRLLFDEKYDEENYTYMFSEKNLLSFNKKIRERLNYFKISILPIISDDSGNINAFNIVEDDILLLNKLLEFRLTDNSDISNINFENLSTNLSKLIFIYLDLKINSNYSSLDYINLLSQELNILENLFELYLVNESHKIIKDWEISIDGSYVKVIPVRNKFIINDEILESKELILSDYPYNLIDFYLYHNSDLVNNSLYEIINYDSTGEVSIKLTDSINLEENDVIVIDYKKEV